MSYAKRSFLLRCARGGLRDLPAVAERSCPHSANPRRMDALHGLARPPASFPLRDQGVVKTPAAEGDPHPTHARQSLPVSVQTFPV
jgi:hypothetical protein